MISLFKKNKALIRKYGYWVFAVVMGVLLIFLEEVDDIEPFFSITAFLYWSLLFYWGARWVFSQIKSTIKLKKEKTHMELMHLQSQVNPHFFFNMLNNLYGLVGKDAKKAQELILKLSDMMRYSIYEGEKDIVKLEGEIDYLKNYIELHKMRYHKKIDISFDSEIQENTKVMPLLFIILLENAFKHGVENLRENAYVYAKMISNANEIHFEVENNFDTTAVNEEQGIGLKNLKRRLELAYSNRHTLTFSKTENVYKAELILKQLW